jgi:hypothetical protein
MQYLESVLDDRLGPVRLEEEPPGARPRHGTPGLGAGRRGEKRAGPARRPRILRRGVERRGGVGAGGRWHRSAGPGPRGGRDVDGLLGAARGASSAIPHGLVLRLGRRRGGVGGGGDGDGGGVVSVGPHARAAGVAFLSWERGGGSGRRGNPRSGGGACVCPLRRCGRGEREEKEVPEVEEERAGEAVAVGSR